MAYFTCSRCGAVTSRHPHWYAGEWCEGPTQAVEPYAVVTRVDAENGVIAYGMSPELAAPTVGPFVVGKPDLTWIDPDPTVLVPDPPKEPFVVGKPEVTDFAVLTDEQKQDIVRYNTFVPHAPTPPWVAPDAPVLVPDPPKEPPK